MRSWIRSAGLGGVVLLTAALGGVPAAGPARSQYYEPKWHLAGDGEYYYKKYHYKAKKTDARYSHQLVVYKPQKTRHWVYWYNPKVKKYWARCATRHHPQYGAEVRRGKDYWSLLPPAKKKGSLNALAEADFPAAHRGGPPIPGSNGKERIQPPPADLPPDK